jgi:ParB-like chromosome segregation protein Spo0J
MRKTRNRKRRTDRRPPAINKLKSATFQNGKQISIKNIVVPKDRRECNHEVVKELVSSMKMIGLKTPITIRIKKKTNRPILVTGLHRLEAARALGWQKIEAVTISNRLEAQLWEIAENLMRSELTPLERAEHVRKWVTLVQRMRDAFEDVGRRRRRGRPEGGVAQAARELPMSGKSEEARRKSVARDIRIAEISPEAKDAIKKAGIDNNLTALLAVGKEKNRKAQLAKVEELAERKRKSARRALAPSSERERELKRRVVQMRNLVRACKNADPALRRLFVVFTIRRDPEFAPLRKGLED